MPVFFIIVLCCLLIVSLILLFFLFSHISVTGCGLCHHCGVFQMKKKWETLVKLSSSGQSELLPTVVVI